MINNNTSNDLNIDKYKALWISHSSMGDFLKCPRLYYYKNIYKDKYRRKIDIPNPHKTLGILIHENVESLANIPYNKRGDEIKNNLLNNYKNSWDRFSGEIGGFANKDEEMEFYNRGVGMINNILNNPELFLKKVIPHNSYKNDMIPNVPISVSPDILLCGNIDWIRYNEEDKTISIIDFKTGKNEESADSLQLFIYYYLLSRLQNTPIRDAYYLYLNNTAKESELVKYNIDDIKIDEKYYIDKLLSVANNILDCKKDNLWVCANDNKDYSCECNKYYEISINKAKYLGIGSYNKSLYIL